MPIRITEVLDYFKEPWYADWLVKVGKKEANRISKAAMKVGSKVDELIKTGSTEKAKDGQEVAACMTAYRKWLAVYKPKDVRGCIRMDAKIGGHDVSGEPDLMVDDVLVDIKCSSKISPKYWIQVNMYRYLRSLQANVHPHHIKLKSVAILRLDKKTGSYEYVVKDYDPRLVSVWCGLLEAYVYLKENDDDGDDV